MFYLCVLLSLSTLDIIQAGFSYVRAASHPLPVIHLCSRACESSGIHKRAPVKAMNGDLYRCGLNCHVIGRVIILSCNTELTLCLVPLFNGLSYNIKEVQSFVLMCRTLSGFEFQPLQLGLISASSTFFKRGWSINVYLK